MLAYTTQSVDSYQKGIKKMTGVGRFFLSMPVILSALYSHRPVNYVADGVCRFPLHPLSGVGVGVQRESRAVVAQGVGQGFHVHAVLQR